MKTIFALISVLCALLGALALVIALVDRRSGFTPLYLSTGASLLVAALIWSAVYKVLDYLDQLVTSSIQQQNYLAALVAETPTAQEAADRARTQRFEPARRNKTLEEIAAQGPLYKS